MDQLVLLGQMVVQVIGENVASVDPRVTVVQRYIVESVVSVYKIICYYWIVG